MANAAFEIFKMMNDMNKGKTNGEDKNMERKRIKKFVVDREKGIMQINDETISLDKVSELSVEWANTLGNSFTVKYTTTYEG